MEDIAAAAGVSAATAYNHFPTKHALVGHIYRPLVLPLLTQAEQDVAAARSMVDALCDQVSGLTQITLRYRSLTAAFWSAVQEYTIRVAGPADPADEIDPRTLAPVPTPIQMLIEHGQATGELRTFPSALDMSGLIVNTMLIRSINRPQEPPEFTCETLLTVMFGMLRPELLVDAGNDGRPFRNRLRP
jgi:AcrR family transcriptional regulator